MKNYEIDVKKLSPGALKEIEALVGSKIVYLVATNVDNEPTFLTPEVVSSEQLTVSKSFPIKTQEITSINSAAFGSYVGSCCYFYQIGGNVYCFEYPC